MKYEERFEELKQNLSVDTATLFVLHALPSPTSNKSIRILVEVPNTRRISGSTAADWIRVHQDTNGAFSYTATLASLIENGSYRDRKFLAERTRIASAVTLSYLLGVDWHKWPNGYPRLQNYRIFIAEGNQTPPLKIIMPFFS